MFPDCRNLTTLGMIVMQGSTRGSILVSVVSLFSEIFSRRFSREKCPTLTVASFFSCFSSDHRPHRVCTTFYRLHSRSHVLVSTRFTVNPAVTGSSPCFSQKLFRAIFFGTVRLAKGSPFKFFDILQQTEVSKSPKSPPFLVFRHYETVSKISFFVFFSKIFPIKILYFLNVSKRSPLNFFDILQQTGISKSRKGPPLTNLKKLRFFEP